MQGWPLPDLNRDALRRGILNPLRLPFRQGAVGAVNHAGCALSSDLLVPPLMAAQSREKKSPPLGEIESCPRVLVVGGSDPSGAAGVFADLKTLTALGVFGTAAVTAVTVQNQHGVTDVQPMSASLVGAQMDAALADAPCDALKTGMLATVDIVHAVAERVERLGSRARLVIDPVLTSSSGRSLLSEEARVALLSRLVPQAALITPNLPEAQALTGVPIGSVEHMGLAADHLLARGAAAVLIKGGHLLDVNPELEEVTDLLRTADGEQRLFVRPRQKLSRRGTGCCLASAVAAGIAEGLTLFSAVERAGDYVAAAMRAAASLDSYRGLAFHHPFLRDEG